MRPLVVAALAAMPAALAAPAVAAPAAARKPDAPAAASGSPRSFPGPDALSDLARRPAPTGVFSEPAEEVDGWTLVDPPASPPPVGAQALRDPWERRLAAHAARRGGEVRATAPMACLARQVGRFVLERRVRPGPATLAFMSSRCGVAEPIGMAMVSLELNGDETDAYLETTLGKPVDQDLRELLRNGPHTAGVWFGREEHRALVMLVTAQPLARLDAFPARPGPDGRVVVKGELLRPAIRVSGSITQGRLGYRACDVDPGIPLPRFAVRCPVDPADPMETLEIAAFQRGRIFGPVVASAQLWPSGEPPAAFARAALDAALTGPVDDGLPATLVGLVNRVRGEAGLAPLALATAQSETAAALAPHYFRAAAGRDEAGMETIVLGLRAGWQVPGLVRGGLFTSSRSDDLQDASRLLSVALARPSGREALLHPEVQAVAVGAHREAKTVGVVFATYALIDPARAAAEREAVVARLDAARDRRGAAPAQPLPSLERRVAELAASIERGETEIHKAAKKIMLPDDPSLGPGMKYSWVGSAERLEEIDFPAELVEARSLRVAVAVAHCRPQGSPWARYCVVLAAHKPKTSTASLGPTPAGG